MITVYKVIHPLAMNDFRQILIYEMQAYDCSSESCKLHRK